MGESVRGAEGEGLRGSLRPLGPWFGDNTISNLALDGALPERECTVPVRRRMQVIPFAVSRCEWWYDTEQ
ncbi:hypothetical protein GB937_007189 [Aspergillus fischeri]|nr:hypothetical protein GB937_007189 [Aspergillus fischeri]